MNSQEQQQHIQDFHELKPGKILAPRKGTEYEVPTLAKKLFANYGFQEREKSVFFNGVTLGTLITLQSRLYAQE